ncbi:MAG: DMT family transporter [Gemmatimonadetes bacterium]|nr:DMT family transporter [Gemmatimonadota bacterium]
MVTPPIPLQGLPLATGPDRSLTLKASLFVVASVLGFGAVPIFTLVATGDGASLETILLVRYVLAALALVALVGGPRGLALPRRRIAAITSVGAVGQVLLTWMALTALRYLPAATASFLFYTYPVWVTLLASATGAERLTRLRVAALALVAVGLAVMIGSPFSGRLSFTGVALSIGAAWVYAAFIPLIGKLQAGVAPTVASAWISVGAAILSGLLALALHSFAPPHGASGWGAIVGLALVSTVTAFILFLRGLALLGPVRTAIISTVEPFFTALLAALVLSQPLTARTFAGGTVVVAAVVLINLGRERSGAEADAATTRSSTSP